MSPPSGLDARVVTHSSAWLAHFLHNRDNFAGIPWTLVSTLTPRERAAIATSIAEFQLGESSEGSHLYEYALRYSRRSGDADYAPAIALFIAEENRHARILGRFMDLAGIPRKRHTFVDRVFRRLRRLGGLELAISVLLTAEIIAQVYYRALRDATECWILQILCRKMLQEERAHVQFQSERLAILRYRKTTVSLMIRDILHRVLMTGTILVVWRNHGEVLRQGGYTFRRFWRFTWCYTERALRIATPNRYRWPTPLRLIASAPKA
jgi:hypothetical protein